MSQSYFWAHTSLRPSTRQSIARLASSPNDHYEETHWGKKADCIRCQRSGKMEQFKNHLGPSGKRFVSAMVGAMVSLAAVFYSADRIMGFLTDVLGRFNQF